jgi:hypothetical protein
MVRFVVFIYCGRVGVCAYGGGQKLLGCDAGIPAGGDLSFFPAYEVVRKMVLSAVIVVFSGTKALQMFFGERR